MTKTDPSKAKKNLLTEGQILNNRWLIQDKIGGGGFGEVYRALPINKSNAALSSPALQKYNSTENISSVLCSADRIDPTEGYVAVKVEATKSQKTTLAIEVAVLRALVGSPNVCQLLATGKTNKVVFIVMTLQGPSLSVLFKKSPQRRFTLPTTLRLACKCLDAIEAVHSVGFLHRDIKPGNFTIRADEPHEVCILDFGLSRKFISSDPRRTIREPRSSVSFRGTVRYASINAHEGRELVVNRWASHLESLDYFTAPEYTCLKAIILDWMKTQGVAWSDPYDWERNYSNIYNKHLSTGSRSTSNRFRQKRPTETDDTRAERDLRFSKAGDPTTMAFTLPSEHVNQNGDKTEKNEEEFEKVLLADGRVYKKPVPTENGVIRKESANSLPLLPPRAPSKSSPIPSVSRKISLKSLCSKFTEGHSRRDAAKEAAK
ncbi:unnamed protein product [Dibothriocephalus latus]|uniref:non-specific serine/threonine protein kinase n=1 Tax=Dibothriocephalus latus TaxID=60516 RepID=A0A3P6UUK1_DIBLA|nr:unnamed protein product [Dibothriocephalus latus]